MIAASNAAEIEMTRSIRMIRHSCGFALPAVSFAYRGPQSALTAEWTTMPGFCANVSSTVSPCHFESHDQADDLPCLVCHARPETPGSRKNGFVLLFLL